MPQGPPKHQARTYNKHEVDGIEVFLPPTLLLNGPALKIGLGGFWKLRWLKVEGAALAASACAY